MALEAVGSIPTIHPINSQDKKRAEAVIRSGFRLLVLTFIFGFLCSGIKWNVNGIRWNQTKPYHTELNEIYMN